MKILKLALLNVFVLFTISCQSQSLLDTDIWPSVSKETKPWTRWWWMGSAVDSANLSKLLTQYNNAGFGGVEITPIYGVKDLQERYIDFLSPAWMNELKITVSEAGKLNMGVDMNTGTGWPFGGPQISPSNAASRLIVQRYSLRADESLDDKIVVKDPRQKDLGVNLEALIAYGPSGEILDITAKVSGDGNLDWKPQSGQWELYAAFCGKTRQKVKRAAPGGDGYTLNHFSKEALDAYLGRFDDAFGDYKGVRAFFNDSYEVYGASWSPGFFDEFMKRRSYDLRLHLRELSGNDENEIVSRIKSDYRQTMSELLLENFTKPWTEWAHTYNSKSKNQAHGSPGNLVDLYAAVDIPECEIFGRSNFPIPGLRKDTSGTGQADPDPLMLKIATSAAHVTGKKLISNETFTWLGEHFKVPLSQCKPEVEEAFLAGINHVFYHGTTYSPADAAWPGWLFYASVNFAPSNSFWPHVNGLNEYITRCQSILQSGKSDNEILVYWPVFDIWNNSQGMEMQLSVHNIREWLVYPAVEEMGKHGYSFDFISDALLQNTTCDKGLLQTSAESLPYKVLIIPECSFMPLETVKQALKLADNGALVIFQKLPSDVPGLYNLEARKKELLSIMGGLKFVDSGNGIKVCKTGKGMIVLSSDIEASLRHKGIKAEKINDYGLKYIRREIEGGKYYFLANHTAKAVDNLIPLNVNAKSVVILDPLGGEFGLAEIKNSGEITMAHVSLLPGESVFLRTSSEELENINPWKYYKPSGDEMTINENWSLAFKSGGPFIPAPVKMETLMPWTETGDTGMNYFSGTAEYSTEFDFKGAPGDEYFLSLGTIYESARVWLNGQDLGIMWSVPFQVKIGKYLKQGENTLRIEVCNLMANRVRYMDQHAMEWRKFNEINFVNIKYKPFDASGWEVTTSGLEGPVKIIPMVNSGL